MNAAEADAYLEFKLPGDALGKAKKAKLESDLEAQALLLGVDFQSPPRPPDRFSAPQKIAAYYAMIELIDWNVGRLSAKLDELGIADEAMVVYFSENGPNRGRWDDDMRGRTEMQAPCARTPVAKNMVQVCPLSMG